MKAIRCCAVLSLLISLPLSARAAEKGDNFIIKVEEDANGKGPDVIRKAVTDALQAVDKKMSGQLQAPKLLIRVNPRGYINEYTAGLLHVAYELLLYIDDAAKDPGRRLPADPAHPKRILFLKPCPVTWQYHYARAYFDKALAMDWPSWGKWQETQYQRFPPDRKMEQPFTEKELTELQPSEFWWLCTGRDLTYQAYGSRAFRTEPDWRIHWELLTPYEELFADFATVVTNNDGKAVVEGDLWDRNGSTEAREIRVTPRDFTITHKNNDSRSINDRSAAEGAFGPARYELWQIYFREKTKSSFKEGGEGRMLRQVYQVLSNEILTRANNADLSDLTIKEANTRIITALKKEFAEKKEKKSKTPAKAKKPRPRRNVDEDNDGQ